MPAYATQSAPKQAQGNPQQQKQPKQEAPKGLAALPQGAGVAALVVMLALALPIGNFRALQNATPQAFIRQGDVKSIVEDRISAAQNAVTEMTNELLRKNADMLKMGTIETAKEAERSVVDLETLRHTNQQLVESLDEVMRIQNEGAQKRKQAEQELTAIEGELKKKLLELRA